MVCFCCSRVQFLTVWSERQQNNNRWSTSVRYAPRMAHLHFQLNGQGNTSKRYWTTDGWFDGSMALHQYIFLSAEYKHPEHYCPVSKIGSTAGASLKECEWHYFFWLRAYYQRKSAWGFVENLECVLKPEHYFDNIYVLSKCFLTIATWRENIKSTNPSMSPLQVDEKVLSCQTATSTCMHHINQLKGNQKTVYQGPGLKNK